MNTEIGIELYRGDAGSRQGLQLDLGCVVQRLLTTFPGIEFEEEYLRRHIEIVRQITAHKPNRAAASIAIRDAEERGPRFRFTVHSPGGSLLKGGFDRHCLSFKFHSDTVDPELKAGAEQFLASFALNRFQHEAVKSDEIAYR